MQVIDFPASARILKMLGVDKGNAIDDITAEIRRIDNAVAALRRRRKLLIQNFRRAIVEENAADTIVIWFCGLPLAFLQSPHHTLQLFAALFG
jgi:hypothetical protein